MQCRDTLLVYHIFSFNYGLYTTRRGGACLESLWNDTNRQVYFCYGKPPILMVWSYNTNSKFVLYIAICTHKFYIYMYICIYSHIWICSNQGYLFMRAFRSAKTVYEVRASSALFACCLILQQGTLWKEIKVILKQEVALFNKCCLFEFNFTAIS